MTLADYPVAIVVWHQPGCGHCEEFLPRVEAASGRAPEVATLLVDATRNEQLADGFDIRATPTVTLLSFGRTVERHDRALKDEQLADVFDRARGLVGGAAGQSIP